MIELKPCPFCGSENVHVERKDLFFWVECYDCGAVGQEARLRDVFVNIAQGEERAANNWNTRPIEDALTTRIAELEAFVGKLIEVGHKSVNFVEGFCNTYGNEKPKYWHDWKALEDDWRERER